MPLSSPNSHNRGFIIAGILVLSLVVVLVFVDPTTTQLAPKCPFKLLTGWQCGGCGCQRAVHAFFHGEFLKAAKYNLFFLYAVPYLLILIAERTFLTGDLRMKVRSVAEHRYVIWFYVVSYCVWTVVRNILGI